MNQITTVGIDLAKDVIGVRSGMPRGVPLLGYNAGRTGDEAARSAAMRVKS